MRFTSVLRLAISGVAIPSCFGADSPYVETRSVLEKWVETRQLVSKSKSDWQASKEMLQQNVQLFEREMAAVADQRSKLSTNNTQIDKERLENEITKKNAEEMLAQARDFSASFEGKVKVLIPDLPVPLQDTLQPLLHRIPTEPNTKMPAAERLQVLVGILNEIDKFNSSITVFNEKRRNSKGDEIAVETVYIGLAVAYFTNETGDFAGSGGPGTKGWDWTVKNDLAPSVREVIRIYRNERPAQFVSLPATIH